MNTFMSRMRKLRQNTSGVAMIEFALALPFFLAASFGGVETANLALTNMRIAQLAVHIADNASRIGDTSTLTSRKIYESDLNDVFYGAVMQAGGSMDFGTHGRAVISSLEVDDASGNQYIHWQRCFGAKAFSSAYGGEGAGLDGSLVGMGPVGEEVTAFEDEAVIYVELAYDYQPLITDAFFGVTEIKSRSSFTVRDDRDLSQIYQRNPASPDPIADCT